jgi:hypothetical protein
MNRFRCMTNVHFHESSVNAEAKLASSVLPFLSLSTAREVETTNLGLEHSKWGCDTCAIEVNFKAI